MTTVFIGGREYVPVPPATNVRESFWQYIQKVQDLQATPLAFVPDALGLSQLEWEELQQLSPDALALPFGVVVAISELLQIPLVVLAVAASNRPNTAGLPHAVLEGDIDTVDDTTDDYSTGDDTDDAPNPHEESWETTDD